MSDASAPPGVSGVPTEAADGWQIATPESVDLESKQLCAVGTWLDHLPQSNIHSILVARRGALAFEYYRSGPDRRWAELIPDAQHGLRTKHDVRSITKCVTGLLIGVALEQRLIPSLREPLFNYLSEYADLQTSDKDQLRLHDLLTMSSGLEWDENVPISDPKHGEMRMWRSADPVRTALEPPLVAPPGSHWNYSGGCTELLGAVLSEATGKPIDAFAREVLFDPLDIVDVEWARFKNNRPSASGGLRMRSRDIAKLGQLVVNCGHWQGRQIVPANWIEESISPQIGADDRLYFYGYHWWLGRSLIERREIKWVAGIGLGGQRLFIVPALEMVVVITGGHYADSLQSWLPLVILNRFELAAARM